MSKMSKAIAVLGVVAGLGVAALPLSTYAADNYSQSTQATVQVKVSGAISIEVDTGNATDSSLLDLGELKLNGATDTKTLNVTVKSNADTAGYDLTIKSATNETALVNENGAKIPALETEGAIAAASGVSAWGYAVQEGETVPTTFKGVKATAEKLNEDGYVTSGTNEGDDSEIYANLNSTKVAFKASANGNQQEGVYSQNVVFTATVK